MTDFRLPHHSASVSLAQPRAELPPGPVPGLIDMGAFRAAYDAFFDVVRRNLRRLGVEEASLDDALQDVFVVVHRRLGDFENRSTLKTWIIGIAVRVAADYRRRKRGPRMKPLSEAIADRRPDPQE